MKINNDAAEICQPLFNTSPIKAFCYVRFFKDNTSYGILTSKQWLIHHFSLNYNLGPPKHLIRFDKERYFCFLTENDLTSIDMLKSYREALNLAHPFYLIEDSKNYVDMHMYCFDSNSNSSLSINFYLNNIEMLEKFNHYFKNKAYYIINNCNKNKILLPNNSLPEFIKNTGNKKHKILDSKLKSNNRLKLLSNREKECVHFILQGYTSKEIAKELAISYRTVETFINRIKIKYDARKLSELVFKLSPHDIL